MKLLRQVLDSPNMAWRRPQIDEHLESNIRGLYIAGDLAGAPVVKLAMEQGDRAIRRIAQDLKGNADYDVAIIGAGAAGLNAALTAKDLGLRAIVLEKNGIASTFADFPAGKLIYAEPNSKPNTGRLWLEESTKEDLLARWEAQIAVERLDVRTGEAVEAIERRADSSFRLTTSKGIYSAKRIVLASGQRGNPRHLGVPGESRQEVMHRLYSPKKYVGEEIVVVGGGNSAVEAALALAEQNQVTLVHRGEDFSRVFSDNARQLKASRIRTRLNSQVTGFGDGYCQVGQERVPCSHSFVLIGAELPSAFLASLGIRLENEWTGLWWRALGLLLLTFLGLGFFGKLGVAVAVASFAALVYDGVRGSRWAWLGVSFFAAYSIYGIKFGENSEFWPYRGWGYQLLSFAGHGPSFWYTILYTALMTLFGLQAMKRWGIDKKDRFQIWRYASLIGFQWLFFFLIPEVLFQLAVKYQWVGERLATDPAFAGQAWRSYGLIYAWPLFFYTFFDSPHQVWIVWGALLSFVIIPVLVLFHGKRYCSWICGCGGLAETFGDRWRHLAPKGPAAIAWERMSGWILGFAALVTVLMLARDLVAAAAKPAQYGVVWYRILADCWLVGILPVTLYPFLGGKVWCRYWCPLARMMQLWSAAFTRFQASHFAIVSNEKCIACGECSRNCQVGIDVMNFAMKQGEINNLNTSCIGCGICITVCPMDVLTFAPRANLATGLVSIASIR